MTNALVKLAAMQIGWFACVLGAANSMPWIGVGVVVVLVAVHLKQAAHPALECGVLASAVVVGFVLDSALVGGGYMAFRSGVVFDNLTTPWMLALWLSFATTLTSPLAWLLARPWMAIAFGAIGGPLAYWSGAKFGALTLTSTTSPLWIGIGWASAMAIFTWLVRSRRRAPISQETAT